MNATRLYTNVLEHISLGTHQKNKEYNSENVEECNLSPLIASTMIAFEKVQDAIKSAFVEIRKQMFHCYMNNNAGHTQATDERIAQLLLAPPTT